MTKIAASLRRYIWFVLFLNILVILWGAYVRATGSGAGCGSHWPLCNGVVIPRALQSETVIEFIHRATSGVALVSVAALWIWVRRSTRSRQLRLSVNLVVLFMVVEALIGAGLVVFELVGENQSLVRAASGSIHLANTFLLLSSLFLTGWLASSGKTVELADKRRLIRWLVVGAIGLILIGSSGAIAALGDTLYPADTLRQGIAADFDSTSPFLVQLRTAHPVIAVAVSALILAMTRSTTVTRGQAVLNAALSVRLILIVQLIAGVINWLLLAPIWLQIAHLLLADLALLCFAWWGAEMLASPSQ